MTCLALIGAMVVALMVFPLVLFGGPTAWVAVIACVVLYYAFLEPRRNKS